MTYPPEDRFPSLINNNNRGRVKQNHSPSARAMVCPVQRRQLGRAAGWGSPGLWPTLWPGSELCVGEEAAVARLSEASRSSPPGLCGAFAQRLPPPRLLGKFSTRAAGGGDAPQRAGGVVGKGRGRGTAAPSKLGRQGPGAVCAHTDTHAHAHTRMHTYARPAQLQCRGPRGPAGSCARARRDCGTAPRGAGARLPQHRGQAGMSGSASHPRSLRSQCQGRSWPPTPSPHLRHPRGGEIFREENFCLHLILEMALFARRQAGWEAQSAERPCARAASVAQPLSPSAAFEQLAGGGRSVPGHHIPTVSAG